MTELKQFPVPDLSEVLDQSKAALRSTLNAINIGIIESFDAVTQTASIRLAIKQIQSTAPDGTRFLIEHPVLLQCPVIFPSGGGYTLTFPISAGDECIVLFNDREIDNWFLNGGVQAPTSKRSHDLSDAIAFVGLRSTPRLLDNVSTSTVQLRNDSGSNFVEVAGGGVIRFVCPTKVRMETPLLEVTGDVVANGISLEHHVHSGVQSGGSNTGEPVT